MWRNIIGQSIYQIAVLLVLKFCGIRLLKLTGANANSILNTIIFNSFVFCQVFNEINSRDMEKINVFSLPIAVVLKFIPVSIKKQTVRDQEDIYEPLLRGPQLA
ncbi:hypothetical protein L3X38_000393 [Prunus dulcis]|uniref:Cation-transporting P-type ATPase C-terminal domain-containing protein n=1 Tax=Prunus dulcis TaxID=3755 RepID=A0AAD4UPW9_PRUDU|nr:hypothetical protein L3X38_000393 [Prunus dulcis]